MVEKIQGSFPYLGTTLQICGIRIPIKHSGIDHKRDAQGMINSGSHFLEPEV